MATAYESLTPEDKQGGDIAISEAILMKLKPRIKASGKVEQLAQSHFFLAFQTSPSGQFF